MAAPGVDVLAPAPGGGAQVLSGTSVAAAYVSGVAALLLEARPERAPRAVRSLLEVSARDLGAPGRDPELGAGRIDARRAVEALGCQAAAPPDEHPLLGAP